MLISQKGSEGKVEEEGGGGGGEQSETMKRRQFSETRLVPIVRHLCQHHISGTDTRIQRRGSWGILSWKAFKVLLRSKINSTFSLYFKTVYLNHQVTEVLSLHFKKTEIFLINGPSLLTLKS